MADPYRRSRYDDDEEPPLRFDDRRPRPRRGGGPAPVTLILSLLVLGGVGGGVFYMYRGGARGSNDAPQPVGAPIGGVRTAAPLQAQAADPAAGLSIYKDDPNASVPPAFVPPPEQPTARQVASAAPPPSVSSQPSVPATTIPSLSAADEVPVVKVKPKPKTETAKPASVDDILDPTPRREATAATPKSQTGSVVVQIGAFSSEHLADQAWSAAAAVAPGAMAGKNKRVVALDKDGTTLYRTAITGFASRDAAQALCDKLKSDGKTCFVR